LITGIRFKPFTIKPYSNNLDEQGSTVSYKRVEKHLLERRSFDVLLAYKPGETTPPKRTYARPVNVTPNGHLGVVVGDRVFPLHKNQDNEYVVFAALESYEPRQCSRPTLKQYYDISVYGSPSESPEIDSFKLEPSDFGTHLLLKCSDSFVEAFVEELVNHKGIRVLSWDSIDDDQYYEWRIDLPSGLNLSKLRERLVHTAEGVLKAISERKDSLQVEHLKRDIEELTKTRDQRSTEDESRIEKLTEELQQAHAEIVRLSTELNQNAPTHQPTPAKSLRRSDGEKALCSILKSIFPNLAFPPDTPRTIIEKFSNSSTMWKELDKLNNPELQGTHKLTSLHGAAGKTGWSELKAHINSGNDSRGRIYTRTSKRNHLYDVVIHWKKNKSEQDRMIRRIANYKPFEAPDVIEGRL